jgi:hypothetical protein
MSELQGDQRVFRNARPGWTGGGGPEDPMLEASVSRLEEDVREIRTDVREIKRDVADLKERFARMEGGFDAIRARLDAMPTVLHFALGLVGTVIAIAALFVSLK